MAPPRGLLLLYANSGCLTASYAVMVGDRAVQIRLPVHDLTLHLHLTAAAARIPKRNLARKCEAEVGCLGFAEKGTRSGFTGQAITVHDLGFLGS